MGMIEELLKEKYKLRIPPTVYYDLLADVVEIEEQEPIIDKIRAEIEETYMNITYQENKDRKATWGLRKAMDIIDKYKAESEGT